VAVPFRFLCSSLGVRFRLAESCERMRALMPHRCGLCPGPKRLCGKVSAAERKKLAKERVKKATK
jgi:hypothetical protein